MLEDIEDWEEVIEWPDLDAIDWEACARKDVPVKDPSKILCAMMVSGPFERLHDLMGFEGALCALVTNPEECEAFFSRLCDFKIEQIKRLKEHYDVDMVHFQDDWGTQTDLMFQPEIWRTLIRPHVKRVVDAAHDLGVLFDQHSCGKIDRIVGEVIDMGIDVLDPVQPVNDLPRWIDEYKDKVVFMGALDAQNVIDRPDATDEEIMAEVKGKIDLFGNAGARFIPSPCRSPQRDEGARRLLRLRAHLLQRRLRRRRGGLREGDRPARGRAAEEGRRARHRHEPVRARWQGAEAA